MKKNTLLFAVALCFALSSLAQEKQPVVTQSNEYAYRSFDFGKVFRAIMNTGKPKKDAYSAYHGNYTPYMYPGYKYSSGGLEVIAIKDYISGDTSDMLMVRNTNAKHDYTIFGKVGNPSYTMQVDGVACDTAWTQTVYEQKWYVQETLNQLMTLAK